MFKRIGIGTRCRYSMEPVSKSTITGPLQERILMLLNYKPQCGKDLMNELGLRSPGTIYPVLDELRKKNLIDYRQEASGSVRRKTYELTAKGKSYVRGSLLNSAKMFCCDASLYVDTILHDAREVIDVKRNQKVLCTVETESVRRFLSEADVTYTPEIEAITDMYDIILAFPGIGCMVGKENIALPSYLGTLCRRLKSGGSILVVEIEKTDNLFAKIFFQDIRKLKKSPGMSPEGLSNVLNSVGLKTIDIKRKSGLLYAVARKD